MTKNTTAGTSYDNITSALAAHGSRKAGRNWNCPKHPDRTPSLTVNQGDKGVILHCQAGCATQDVVNALGLTLADLFDNHNTSEPRRVDPQVTAAITRLRETITAHPWKGPAGRTDRDVLLAAVTLAGKHQTLTVILPRRGTGLLAGVGEKTVSRSLKRLVTAGWITKARKRDTPLARDRAEHANAYTLNMLHNDPLRTSLTPYPFTKPSGSFCNVPGQGSEFAAWLGKADTAVLTVLGSDPLTGAEIARRAGVHPSTVSRALKTKLGPAGLAVSIGKRWAAGRNPAGYDPGTRIVEKRAATYARDREHFKRGLALYRGEPVCAGCGRTDLPLKEYDVKGDIICRECGSRTPGIVEGVPLCGYCSIETTTGQSVCTLTVPRCHDCERGMVST